MMQKADHGCWENPEKEYDPTGTHFFKEWA
jgi:hypothetical protein